MGYDKGEAGKEVEMDLEALQTPALILDKTILQRNTQAMTRRIAERGCRFRPHMKTAKSIDVARYALDGNFGGITVSTVNEAEYFAARGFTDILYAVCITPDKAARLARLMATIDLDLKVITDSKAAASLLNTVGKDHGIIFDCLIEIDSGEHRTGVDPIEPEFIELARYLYDSPSTALGGILTHAGHAYNVSGAQALQHIADEERAICLEAADRLRLHDLPCHEISLGSTPTAVYASSAEGITETRAGVYMFGDVFQYQIGAHQLEDIAVSVLATVISHNRRENRIVVDAGGLALSKDAGTGKTGYGLITTMAGAILPGRYIASIYQEHGEIAGVCEEDFQNFPIGSRLRILPNHICMTAAMYSGYHVVESGTEINAWWPRTNGWQAAGDPL